MHLRFNNISQRLPMGLFMLYPIIETMYNNINYHVDLVKPVRFLLLYKTSNLKKQSFLICLCFFYQVN